MTQTTLSRKDRRARAARAVKHYGISDGAAALTMHGAYEALAAADGLQAARLAHEVSQTHPSNRHPWIVLGTVALDRREAAAGAQFFERALLIAPADPVALAGLGKARVLQADIFGAVDLFARAIEHGSEDVAMARLYADLMGRLDRSTTAGQGLRKMAERMKTAELWLITAEAFARGESNAEAAPAYEQAARLAPTPIPHRIGLLKAKLFRQDYAGVIAGADALLPDTEEESGHRDEIVTLRMAALRAHGDPKGALDALSHRFRDPVYYQRALGFAAQCHLDRNELHEAGIAFRQALHVLDGAGPWVQRAYGTFLMGQGDFVSGASHYAGRQPDANRRRIPYENSAPERLATRQRLFLVDEQGIGDQLALLPIIERAPLPAGARITFVGDPRLKPLLERSRLEVEFAETAEFETGTLRVAPEEMIFVGDLARYLSVEALADHPLGAYLRPDTHRVDAIRARYRARAQGGPVVGIAWHSSDPITGAHRSIALETLLAALPAGMLAVNLQYGARGAELAEAARTRPDLTLFDDPEIDQLADLDGFAAQIMALDRVVSIDNTTAHICGALAHPDAHVLIPKGAACMWYWGREGCPDRWYGNLTLHRQTHPGDWSVPLSEIAALSPR
ncbi:tetratricopeptide repeat protein [Thioclava atlantica]|uniref:Glycosyl transferase family protein n=1 Tax=Thioclava atlantica TaxID=1317124 RepID=A0A085TY71_9RHOB|nr:hypothetical protein [Thioclava atlantica]KFE35668.1 glycosyl transferase family protein [Thioclava atlantica]